MCDAIKATWNDVVAKDLQGHGINIFVKFLTTYPDQQKKFAKFASVPAGSLAGNKDLATQALNVMNKLNEFVNAGDLKAATKAMAASHKTMGICDAEFSKMMPIIVDYVVEKTGSDKAAWTGAMNAIKTAITSQQ